MEIKYWSDVHSEFSSMPYVAKPGDDQRTLVIAGDFMVGDSELEELRRLCSIFKHVIYTCGNHEYYGQVIDFVNARLSRFALDVKNFYFLNPGIATIDGVRFIGATLWTDMNKGDFFIKKLADKKMNDYRQIRVEDHDGYRCATPKDTILINEQHREFIERALSEPFDGKTVVVTHHAPSVICVPEKFKVFKEDLLINFCYHNTGMEDWFFDYKIDVWIHGHIHTRQRVEINDVPIFVNARGYTNYNRSEMDVYDTVDTILTL